MKLGHVTPRTPTYGRFVVRRQGGTVLYVCTKFEADSSFRSKVIWGSKFCPAADPLPAARDGQNLISWRWSLPLPTTQFGEDRCTQFRVIVVTDPQTHEHTQTGPITIHCAAKLSAKCNDDDDNT